MYSQISVWVRLRLCRHKTFGYKKISYFFLFLHTSAAAVSVNTSSLTPCDHEQLSGTRRRCAVRGKIGFLTAKRLLKINAVETPWTRIPRRARGKSNISKTFHRTCILLLLLTSSSSSSSLRGVRVWKYAVRVRFKPVAPAYGTFKPAAECAASPLCARLQSRRPSRFYYGPTRNAVTIRVGNNYDVTCSKIVRERTRIQFQFTRRDLRTNGESPRPLPNVYAPTLSVFCPAFAWLTITPSYSV